MNEARRVAYLDAMGIDSYVSRSQLPGAAVSRRLQVVRTVPAAPVAEPPAVAIDMPDLSSAGKPRSAPDHTSPVRPTPSPTPTEVPRFCLTTLVAGDWLWLEDTTGVPLASEQVWLVEGMAQAVQQAMRNKDEPLSPVKARVQHFNWPMHGNQQLDQGEASARDSVQAFMQRCLDQYGCRGVVLLGEESQRWLATELLSLSVVKTLSTVQLLQQPMQKKQAWRDLAALIQGR